MDLSNEQKAIFSAFKLAGLNNIDTFQNNQTGTRYVKGNSTNNKFLFSHQRNHYVLTCNDDILIATFDPVELRRVINKIMENPNAHMKKSDKSMF